MKEQLYTHSEGFTDLQLTHIYAALNRIKDTILPDGIFSFHSGGGFFHIFVKLKTNQWVMFHSESEDVEIIAYERENFIEAWANDLLSWETVKGMETYSFIETEKIIQFIIRNLK